MLLLLFGKGDESGHPRSPVPRRKMLPDVQCSEPSGGGAPTAGSTGVPVSMQGHLGALNKAGEPGEGVVVRSQLLEKGE